MKRLSGQDSAGAVALRFLILTAARSGEVLNATWNEIDLESKIWTIPASRMKAAREHRVPLSGRALAIVKRLAEMTGVSPQTVGRALVPDGTKNVPRETVATNVAKSAPNVASEQMPERPIPTGEFETIVIDPPWPMTRSGPFVFPGLKRGRPLSSMALEMLLRRMNVETTVHGFRSSFRDWAGDATDFPREVAEAALAHVIGDKAEQAYRRGDALEKRRALMDAWGAFVEPKQ